MVNLIKNELFKMKKDKSLKVALIVTLILTVITILSNMLVNELFENINDDEIVADLFIDVKYSVSTFFSLGNNFGFILPVFIAIFICKDFSYGTIRNKIIAGYNKTKVYLSTLFSSMFIGIVLVLINLTLTIILSLVLLKGDIELLWLLKICGLGMLVYIETLSFITMIAMITRSQSLTIITSMGVIFIGIIAVSILDLYDTTRIISDFIFLKHSNIITSQGAGVIDSNYVLTFGRTLRLLVSSVLFVGGTTLLGMYTFKHKDLK